MILECDVGNSRYKWRLLDEGEIISRGSHAHGDVCEKFRIMKGVSRICIASVASNDVLNQFVQTLKPLVINPEFAVTAPSAAGVECGYEDHLRLGVDRWLAVVAGYNKCQGAVLVLDVGSALTADVVTGRGRHLGGYIAPGSTLLYSSLLSNTGQVRFDGDLLKAGLNFGETTELAVNAGVLSSLIGSVLVAISQATKYLGADFSILMTGGDAAKLASTLSTDFSIQVELMPDLVLDGLALVLP